MPFLTPSDRRALESAIRTARAAADAGAKNALQTLSVGAAQAPDFMGESARRLRNRLRAHGRSLGDTYDRQKGTQETRRLERELAYEHWHRMLFARFLAENELLIDPASKVAISLAEAADLAHLAGQDPWEFAARAAQTMLPGIFRPADPVLEVPLAPETRTQLERLVAGLPASVFTAEDALGWTYQFWQGAEKEAVNLRMKSGEKITGATLPAVTQLFTEPYMVDFLLHNTIGAWHAGKVLARNPELAIHARSESELRAAVALPECTFDYLRFVREPRPGDAENAPSGPWRPAAGTYPTWPPCAASLTVLDPCAGSGHFLVAAFQILVSLRQDEEQSTTEAAVRNVLAENLFGLELDPRCTQIAAFHLAFAAWKRVGRPMELPPLAVACSGLAPSTSKEEWLRLAGQVSAEINGGAQRSPTAPDAANVQCGLEALYELFQQAPELGSLIDPHELTGSLFSANFRSLEPLLLRLFDEPDDDTRERAVAAAGMAKSARILLGPSQGYTLVATNVPYLGRKSQSEALMDWIDEYHQDAKSDLATVFVSRMLKWVKETGTVAAVTPQNWLFLTSYRKLRERLLVSRSWNFVVRLGTGAFETIGGHVVNVALLVIGGAHPWSEHSFAGVDLSNVGRPAEKAALLREDTRATNSHDDLSNRYRESTAHYPEPTDINFNVIRQGLSDSVNIRLLRIAPQRSQVKNPDCRITSSPIDKGGLLQLKAEASHGIGTFDSPSYTRTFWEIDERREAWIFQQSTPDRTGEYGGACYLLLWELGAGRLALMMSAKEEGGYSSGKWKAGTAQWGKPGVISGQMHNMPCSLYLGRAFDENATVITPAERSALGAIWAFQSSSEFCSLIRKIDDSIKVTCKSLVKVPSDLERWQKVAAEKYPHGLPEPQSNDPTQWLFHGHPAGMLASGEAARSPWGIADPLGAERHASLLCRTPNLKDVLQVAVARLVGYRWPAEEDATMRLDPAVRAWVGRCRELDEFCDGDGIVCLPALHGEGRGETRLRKLLAEALKELPGGFQPSHEGALLSAAGGAENPPESLEAWLRDRFFEEHCALFHHRPFVWHIWDGRRDGFSALVNYHRLAGPDGQARRTLDALAQTYLGEWIVRQQAEVREGVEGAEARLAAALTLRTELERIREGEPPYDLFVRWKPLHAQPEGWAPELDDGVRLNIRPFLLANAVGKKGAGVLRAKPNVKWTKDRGTEPRSLRPSADFPWFWGCAPDTTPAHRTNFGAPVASAPPTAAFDGTRWNDLHYSRAAKSAARAAFDSRAAGEKAAL